ncbi:hypothetical protein, partial [Paenibacillus sp. HGF7]|uniref:hypothetical protein n=1 Tax=Paenibacillus sp. HGF7 TaxID=944559 RepID=UPI001BAB71C3
HEQGLSPYLHRMQKAPVPCCENTRSFDTGEHNSPLHAAQGKNYRLEESAIISYDWDNSNARRLS